MFSKLLTSIIFSVVLASTNSLEAFSISLGFGFQPVMRPVIVTQTVPVVHQEVTVVQQPLYQPIYQPVMQTCHYTTTPVYSDVRTMYVTDHAPVFTSHSSFVTFKSAHKHRRHRNH